MTDPIQHLRELMGKATSGEWTLRYIYEGLSAGCYAIDIPSNKWREMSTWYIGRENADLAVALRNLAPALLDVVEAARILLKNQSEYGEVNWSELYKALAALDGKGEG